MQILLKKIQNQNEVAFKLTGNNLLLTLYEWMLVP